MTGKNKNKAGVLLLRGDEDFTSLFMGEENTADAPADDFAVLLESTLDKQNMKAVCSEKERSAEALQVSIREQIKHYPAPEEEIDLHHYTAREAARKAEAFMRSAAYRGLKTVRIIVGKGLHSEGRAVLPDVIELTAAALKKAGMVLTFLWEKKEKHKSGSLLVY
ncbi:MAG: Smr/MutS family protein, partial [Pseudomonadota bacterium]